MNHYEVVVLKMNFIKYNQDTFKTLKKLNGKQMSKSIQCRLFTCHKISWGIGKGCGNWVMRNGCRRFFAKMCFHCRKGELFCRNLAKTASFISKPQNPFHVFFEISFCFLLVKTHRVPCTKLVSLTGYGYRLSKNAFVSFHKSGKNVCDPWNKRGSFGWFQADKFPCSYNGSPIRSEIPPAKSSPLQLSSTSSHSTLSNCVTSNEPTLCSFRHPITIYFLQSLRTTLIIFYEIHFYDYNLVIVHNCMYIYL